MTELRTARSMPLDGLRGLAILVVLIHNSSWILQSGDSFLLKLPVAITAMGWTGVQLFFVLSGFLITGVLLDTRNSPSYFRTYYIRRTLRIFPLYYVFLACALLIVPHFSGSPAWNSAVARNSWLYWTYVSNWGEPFGRSIPGISHFWSLAVEEQFYLIWPLAVYLLARKRLTLLCLVMIATSPIARYLLRSNGLPYGTAYSFTFSRWDALAAGAFVAALMHEEMGRQWLRKYMPAIAGSSVVCLLLLIGVQHGFHEAEMPIQVFGQSIVAVASAALVWFAAVELPGAQWITRVLSAKWLRFFGKYSYGIYVFHFPIQKMLLPHATDLVNDAPGAARILRLVIYLAFICALSTLCALVSWNALEKPILKWRDKLAPSGV